MPLGNPIRKQNESRIISVLATEGQSVFTVEGGYTINQISVFRNGVRLSNAEDFTAGDGSTVTLNNEANVDDRIEFHIFDKFTVQNAIVSAASSQTINGDLVLTGKLFGTGDFSRITTGIVTATQLDLNGSLDVSSTSVFNDDVTFTGAAANITFDKSVDDLIFNDNAKAAFGTSSDLIIFHDGTISKIQNSSSGQLEIVSNDIELRASTGDSQYFTAQVGGAATVFYGNNVRLETTPSGIDVTGTLSVTGISTFTGNILLNQSDPKIFFNDGGSMISNANVANTLAFFSDGSTERARITSGGEFLIGTTTDANIKLDVEGSVRAKAAAYVAPASGTGLELYYATGTLSDTPSSYLLSYDRDSSAYKKLNIDASEHKIRTSGTERLRITTAGKIGINQTSPQGELHIGAADNSNHEAMMILNNGGATGQEAGIEFRYENNTTPRAKIHVNSSDTILRFSTANSEAMTIDASQRVGIGENTPQSTLVVRKDNQGGRGGEISIVNYAGGGANGIGNEAAINFGLENSTYGLNDGNAQIKALTTAASNSTDIVFSVYSGSSFGEALRITSAGKIGIGTITPIGSLDVRDASGSDPTMYIGHSNADVTGEFLRIGRVDLPTIRYHSIKAEHSGGASSNTIEFHLHNSSSVTSQTEVMRLQGDGKVGINKNNPDRNLHVVGSNYQVAKFESTNSNSDGAYIELYANSPSPADNDILGILSYRGNNDASQETTFAQIRCQAIDVSDGTEDGSIQFHTRAAGTFGERMRITARGRFGFNENNPSRTLHVQTNTTDGNIGVFAGENVLAGNNATMFFLSTIQDSSGTYKFMQCNRDQDNSSQGVAAVFDVLTNGNVRNLNNSYGSISDVRLKENIIDASSQWNDIKNVKVRKFNFKDTPSETLIGVVAQEIETVSPGLVADMPDMDLTKEGLEGTSTKSVKYSVLYMKAIKCLQEAQARIETLEAKVAALEGS